VANQFLIMLKPELMAEAAQAGGADLLHDVLGHLAARDVNVHAARVVGCAELARHQVVERHYPTLNQVSRHGLAAVPDAARARLADRFPALGTGTGPGSVSESTGTGTGPRVLGGHQLLTAFPGLTPFALDALAHNLPVTKVAAGVYAVEIVLDGERLIVLNAFHPCQVAHFNQLAGHVVFLECHTQRDTAELRSEVIGATDPGEACPGSLKHLLYTRRDSFVTWKVCTRLNGVHASPGPVEAMFTLQRYFADSWESTLPLSHTSLGQRLLATGADARQIQALQDNPPVRTGELDGPLFDVTEDMDPDAAFDLLTTLLRSAPAGPGLVR
jgi:hypothetical protein